MKRLIIDGYNLLYQTQADRARSLSEQRDQLLESLLKYQRQKSVALWVIFDSSYDAPWLLSRDRVGSIEIVYTRDGQNADQWIKNEVSKGVHETVVVTSDRDIIAYVEMMNGIWMSSQDFLKRLAEVKTVPENPYFEDKIDDEGPLYPRIHTKKKGVAKKLSKRERKRSSAFKNL